MTKLANKRPNRKKVRSVPQGRLVKPSVPGNTKVRRSKQLTKVLLYLKIAGAAVGVISPLVVPVLIDLIRNGL